jgi:hypothetical protein
MSENSKHGSLQACKTCFYKRKYHTEYMRSYRYKNKNEKQLYFPLQESLHFKSVTHEA